MKSKYKVFNFNNIVLSICGYISFLCPISISIILLFNFNIFVLFAVILLFIIIITLNFYYHINRIEVYDDRIEYYGLKKKTFKYQKIESIEVDKRGYIVIIYDKKKYLYSGYVSFLSQTSHYEKNNELVEYINTKIKKNNRWY